MVLRVRFIPGEIIGKPGQANTGMKHAERWPPTVVDLLLLLEAKAADIDYTHSMPVGSYPSGGSASNVVDVGGKASKCVLDWYIWGGCQELSNRIQVDTAPTWNHTVRFSSWLAKDGEQGLVEDLSCC